MPELARFLKRLEIRKPRIHGDLGIFPLTLRKGEALRGRWSAMDEAIESGILVVTEQKIGAAVPVIYMENRSPDRHVFVMGGEVVSGGKQTRTIRKDIVLAPGQKLDIGAFCVEAGRWHGDQEFESSALMLPQSVQKELRKGTDQKRVWAEVDRINRSLGSQNATSSLEIGLNAAPVRKRLGRVRAAIVPKVPGGSIGFVFVYRGRAVGAEFFGRPDLARALLPKILDAYAVDFVLREPGRARRSPAPREHIAAAFLNHVRLAGSTRSETAGSGAGIRTRSAGLVGEGVSLGDSLVHFGVQIEKRIMPAVEKVPTRRGRVP